jgi:hypothetical protein
LLTPSLGRAGRRLVVDKFVEAARQMRRLKQHSEAMRRAIDHPERWVADGGRA